MSRNFDMIGSINDAKETLKLAVRIVDLWTVQPRENSKHLEMVLMDGKRDKIHTIVKKEDFETWEAELNEGKTYYMYNFRVAPNDGQYRVCAHPFKLFFTGGTTLKQLDIPDIPFKSYDFKTFEDITKGDYDPNLLIDIIGVVEEIKFQLPNGNPAKVVFNLKDLSGQIIGCTLWSNHATRFMICLKECQHLSPPIILLTQARVKPPQGVHGLSISNSLYGSKLLINDEVPDFAIYKKRLSGACFSEASNANQSLSIGQSSQSSEFSEVDRFFYKSKVVRISNLGDIADGTNFCTVGTTKKLIAGKGGWFYNACGQCTKKADHEDVSYTCSCGKFNETSIARYRVEIMVCHNKESGNFVFWDRDCTQIIGMSASELRKLMKETDESGPKHFPHHLDKMLGLTVALKCKYQQKFNSSSVMKMSDNPDIMKTIIDDICIQEGDAADTTKPTSVKTEAGQAGTSQTVSVAQSDQDSTAETTKPLCTSKIDNVAQSDQGDAVDTTKPTSVKTEAGQAGTSQTVSVAQSDQDNAAETTKPPHKSKIENVAQSDQSLSVTAEHDPDEHIMLTPTKRSASELSPDEPPTEAVPSAQLSATKLPKHIKDE